MKLGNKTMIIDSKEIDLKHKIVIENDKETENYYDLTVSRGTFRQSIFYLSKANLDYIRHIINKQIPND